MIEDWNIEGIAKEVIQEMRDADAPIDDVDDYVHHIAYISVYSRVPDDATMVAEMVKKKVKEQYDSNL